MEDTPLWAYISILFLIFIGSGIYFKVVSIYAYAVAMFALAFSVLIIKYMIMPRNVGKKYWLIIAVLALLVVISFLNPDAVSAIVNRLFS